MHSFFVNSLILMLKGASYTITISFFGCVIGLVFGSVIGVINSRFISGYKFLRFITNSYVSLIRGTPIFVQILLIYFGLPNITNINLSPLTAGILALGLNSSAYLAETLKGGVNSISIEQWESAMVLGYSKLQSFRYIIMPQALSNVFPSLTNEFVSLIKESSILMALGITELTKVARDIATRELKPMEAYLMCAGVYFMLTTCFSLIAKFLERRLNRGHR